MQLMKASQGILITFTTCIRTRESSYQAADHLYSSVSTCIGSLETNDADPLIDPETDGAINPDSAGKPYLVKDQTIKIGI